MYGTEMKNCITNPVAKYDWCSDVGITIVTYILEMCTVITNPEVTCICYRNHHFHVYCKRKIYYVTYIGTVMSRGMTKLDVTYVQYRNVHLYEYSTCNIYLLQR